MAGKYLLVAVSVGLAGAADQSGTPAGPAAAGAGAIALKERALPDRPAGQSA